MHNIPAGSGHFSRLNECCSRGTIKCSCQHNIVSESQAECYFVEILNPAKINITFLDHALAKELLTLAFS